MIDRPEKRTLLLSRTVIAIILVVLLSAVILSCAGIRGKSTPAPGDLALSPTALALDSERGMLYVAERDANRIDIINVITDAIERSFVLGKRPNGLVLSLDGVVLFVACGSDEGRILAIDTTTGKVLASAPAGHTPLSPIISPDGSMLYVCSRFDDCVRVFDSDTLDDMWIIPALREPVDIDITPDGRYVFIANHLPSGKMIQEHISDGGVYMIGSYQSTGYFNSNREAYVFSAVVLVYDTKYKRLVDLIKLPNGSTAVRGLTVSPDGKNVYVSHILARYHLPTTQLDRGWINTNAMSVIDADSLKFTATVLLDDLDRGAANPWGIDCSPDGSRILVAHAGTHELSVINRRGLHNRLALARQGEKNPAASRSLGDVQNDLSFLYGLRERIPLAGKGPRAIVADDSSVYVASYYSDIIERVGIDGSNSDRKTIRLANTGPMSAERLGELYFNDADLCFQGWLSCASCHPDSRADGLNWDLLNDGIGNPKNTKSLLLSHATPPAMVLGVRKDAETGVRAGLIHSQLTTKPEAVAVAIDSYLMSMKTEKAPLTYNGQRRKTLRRGRKIFNSATCGDCHSGPLYTDLNLYNIGLGQGKDASKHFDTPTLVELWRTAPYLYDGRADTLYDVLKTHNKDDEHGITSNLSQSEISDLITYLLSL